MISAQFFSSYQYTTSSRQCFCPNFLRGEKFGGKLQSRLDVMPYATEAQSVGKTTKLCEEGSAFRTAYDQCVACLVTSTDDDNATSYISTSFQQYFDFCNFTDTSGVTTVVQRITAVANITVAGQAVPFTTITADVTISLTGTASVTTSDAGEGAVPLTATNSTVSASPTITTDSNLIPSAEPTTSAEHDSSSKAWMAGPIVGSVSGIAIIALIIFLLYRRRTAKRTPHSDDFADKPQLHSDCVPRPLPEELDAGMRHELPGDEPRDQNALINELPAKESTTQGRTFGKIELPSYEPRQLPS
ncbi:hypothetical protein PFICI_09557 [Pestalotiopsis fici W106-1]|uniref:Uncharacterized protein n=1 Tax=Pestalotiopsis fici (strain W106-1 / CGMCC3.15140) TaxID=1229662 RepID=W3X0Y3_PESFW|nr:uncharacterized protein PFICI_09557 [Pestalotiopsis fici W106-1]ETS79704.1 hypothetical protein PFICI_09557 [Pestalotiopsis fici W106-1]